MANEKAVLFIGSDRPVRGKEQEAKSLWLEIGGWLDQQKAAGYCTRWDGCWLTPHGSDLNSAILCYGERSKLDEWRRTDAFEAWVFRMMNVLEGVCVVPGVNFAAARETMSRMDKAIGPPR